MFFSPGWRGSTVRLSWRTGEYAEHEIWMTSGNVPFPSSSFQRSEVSPVCWVFTGGGGGGGAGADLPRTRVLQQGSQYHEESLRQLLMWPTDTITDTSHSPYYLIDLSWAVLPASISIYYTTQLSLLSLSPCLQRALQPDSSDWLCQDQSPPGPPRYLPSPSPSPALTVNASEAALPSPPRPAPPCCTEQRSCVSESQSVRNQSSQNLWQSRTAPRCWLTLTLSVSLTTWLNTTWTRTNLSTSHSNLAWLPVTSAWPSLR